MGGHEGPRAEEVTLYGPGDGDAVSIRLLVQVVEGWKGIYYLRKKWVGPRS